MVRLALAGEFDLSNAAQVEDALKEIERERPPLLVLDLRELTFMDSTGSTSPLGRLGSISMPATCG